MRIKPLAVNRYQIKINTESRQLFLYDGGTLVKTYPVGVGKQTTPTPHGSFKIRNKIVRPGGVLGSRWLGLDVSPNANYGIHGTNKPASIGGYVSLGCVRMFNHDVEDLFSLVSIGTPVEITGNDQYAQKFSYIAQPSPGQKTYTIKPGDTLWNLSQKFGVPLQTLIQANMTTDPNKLFPGQTIIIP